MLAERVNQKRQIAAWYATRFDQVDGIELMPEVDFGRSTRWLTVATLDPSKLSTRPLEIIAALESHNIESRPVWKPLHLQKAFADCRCIGGEVSADLYENGICLPSGTIMDKSDVDRVCDIVLDVLK